MKLTSNWLYLFLIVIFIMAVSGCSSSSPYTKSSLAKPVEPSNSKENHKNINNENAEKLQGTTTTVSSNEATSQQAKSVQDATDAAASQNSVALKEVVEPTDQELIDNALEYCQTSSDFLERGDFDNAVDALDKAYSYILKVDGTGNPELLQQREDIRLTISKKITEAYSTRYTAVNGNHKAIPLDMNSEVQAAIDYFIRVKDSFFLDAYARSGKYRPAIVKALKQAGMPEELSWLPFIESGFKVKASSTARALGMWQFIASTGYRYGLKRDTWIDERMDPEKSTAAAIGYLSDLHQMFGDWTTVLAAYNCGERRVQNEIDRQKISYLDNFWDLYPKLPNETAFYVPKFLAVLHILNDPKKYGFELPPLENDEECEEVTIAKQLSLATISKSIDVDCSTLKTLNPELRQETTPKTPYNLKLPLGKGEVLLANLNDIPSTYLAVAEKSSRSSNVYHTVRSGDTLSAIAKKYKTSVKTIMSANGLKSQRTLKIGSKLKISTTKKTVVAEASGPETVSKSTGEVTKYVVKKGDSLFNIAKRYNTSVQSLKVLNGLTDGTLSVGQEILLSPGIATASKDAETQKYTVRKGDYPYTIAKKYNMDLYDFLKLNGLSPGSTIFPGQEVQVTVE
jgi:membrane-bound lytic murein transglycosylase D